jgi:hypothetical protein
MQPARAVLHHVRRSQPLHRPRSAERPAAAVREPPAAESLIQSLLELMDQLGYGPSDTEPGVWVRRSRAEVQAAPSGRTHRLQATIPALLEGIQAVQFRQAQEL